MKVPKQKKNIPANMVWLVSWISTGKKVTIIKAKLLINPIKDPIFERTASNLFFENIWDNKNQYGISPIAIKLTATTNIRDEIGLSWPWA